MKRASAVLLTVTTAILATAAYAHTSLASSSPASGSILTTSPPVIDLRYHEDTRLTAVDLANSAGERRLAFSPEGASRSFRLANPRLLVGRNEIRWRALSRDGHVVEGSVIIVIRAARQ